MKRERYSRETCEGYYGRTLSVCKHLKDVSAMTPKAYQFYSYWRLQDDANIFLPVGLF